MSALATGAAEVTLREIEALQVAARDPWIFSPPLARILWALADRRPDLVVLEAPEAAAQWADSCRPYFRARLSDAARGLAGEDAR